MAREFWANHHRRNPSDFDARFHNQFSVSGAQAGNSMSAPPTPIGHYATIASVCLVVLSFVTAVAVDLRQGTASGLESHLAKAGAAGSIPTALLLIYGAIDPSVINQLSGLNVWIAAAGLSLLYISAKAILKK
jgi:hypothetical protein